MRDVRWCNGWGSQGLNSFQFITYEATCTCEILVFSSEKYIGVMQCVGISVCSINQVQYPSNTIQVTLIYHHMYALIRVHLLTPHGGKPSRFLCPWDFPGKNPGVGCHFLLQGILLMWESKASLASCIGRQILYHCSTREAQYIISAQ